MTEKSREEAIRDMMGWLGSIQGMANIPDDELNTRQPDQLVNQQARCAQLEILVQQSVERLTTLVKALAESVAALLPLTSRPIFLPWKLI